MKNIKTLLILMGSAALSTVAISSVVACGDEQAKTSVLNCKYGILLNWYQDENISLIRQKIRQRDNQYDVCIENTNLITNTKFKDRLLIDGSAAGKFKAKDTDAASFLAELGFESGNENNDYHPEEVAKIDILFAKKGTNKPGEISENGTTDFKIAAGTCQVEIMNNILTTGKVVKTYTVKTNKNDSLNVKRFAIDGNIADPNAFNLTANQGFKEGEAIDSFKLKLASIQKQIQFDSLVSLLNTTVKTTFFDAVTGGAVLKGNFTNRTFFLEITFGNVVLVPRIDCGTPITV